MTDQTQVERDSLKTIKARYKLLIKILVDEVNEAGGSWDQTQQTEMGNVSQMQTRKILWIATKLSEKEKSIGYVRAVSYL